MFPLPALGCAECLLYPASGRIVDLLPAIIRSGIPRSFKHPEILLEPVDPAPFVAGGLPQDANARAIVQVFVLEPFMRHPSLQGPGIFSIFDRKIEKPSSLFKSGSKGLTWQPIANGKADHAHGFVQADIRVQAGLAPAIDLFQLCKLIVGNVEVLSMVIALEQRTDRGKNTFVSFTLQQWNDLGAEVDGTHGLGICTPRLAPTLTNAPALTPASTLAS